MDPISAFGVAVNVIQLVDFASKLVSNAEEIYRSGDGELIEHAELKTVTEDLLKLTLTVDSSIKERRLGHKALSESERGQERLGQECRHVASELLTALNRLKAEGRHAKWNSMRQALRTVMRKDKIDQLEKRLDRYRQELIANVLSRLREDIHSSTELQVLILDNVDEMKRKYESFGELFLQQIGQSQRWREDLIEAIRQNTWQSQRSFTAPSSDQLEYISTHETGNSRPIMKMLAMNILLQLRYTNMYERLERIVKAYHQTFEWILDSEDSDSRPWASFASWLKSDESLYWITGKPGSGKSTLIKFLFHDGRTSRYLKESRSDVTLINAAFFFWNSGSRIQMSQMGFLRSLLFDILRQDLGLVPRVFPERFEVCRLFGRDPSEFTWAELANGLKSLGRLDNLKKSFCLFIDGLDEFDGDHTELIDFLKDLASFKNIKICAASRPWPVFEEAFNTIPSLMLQDLTARDIQRFVEGKFNENLAFRELADENLDYAKKLLSEITSRSAGVFLWVHLVVQSLLKGLTNGDRISDLESRLNELPRDLEALFQKMLDSLDPLYREHASQILQMHRAACSPITLLGLSFADQEDPGVVFAAKVKPLTIKEKRARCRTMKRRVMSRCKGLLEVVQIKSVDGGEEAKGREEEVDMKVEYLHRTVKDFFENPLVWQRLAPTREPFDPYRRLCMSIIMQVKTFPPGKLTVDMLWDFATSCIEYAAMSKQQTSTILDHLLDDFDQALTELSNSPQDGGCKFLQKYGNNCVGPNRHWTHTRFSWITPDPFLHLAAAVGLTSYLEAKLGRDYPLAVLNDTESTPLLYSATCSGMFSYLEEKPFCARSLPHTGLIKTLLESGADPNLSCRGLTAWRNVLLSARKDAGNERTRYAWLELIDLFEEHGATPHVDRTSKNWKIVPSPGERIGPPESRRAGSLKFDSSGAQGGNHNATAFAWGLADEDEINRGREGADWGSEDEHEINRSEEWADWD